MLPLPKVIHPAAYAIHKSIKNSLPFLAGREFLLLPVFQKFHAEIVFPKTLTYPRLAFLPISSSKVLAKSLLQGFFAVFAGGVGR